jgi:uncharacterized membrane protein YhaH (DUF805 family)
MARIFETMFNPVGTVDRRPYWFGLSFVFILFFLVFIVSGFQEMLLSRGLGAVRLLVIVPMIWTVLVLVIKRLRDASRSPLWVLFLLVPGLNFLAILFIGTLQNRTSALN